MIRRLLSLFLAFVTILSLLPTAAFAASSEEDALGEVDIYNGDYELGYLAINGTVRKQKYTYFLYESNDGSTKESPAFLFEPFYSFLSPRVRRRKLLRARNRFKSIGRFLTSPACSPRRSCPACRP